MDAEARLSQTRDRFVNGREEQRGMSTGVRILGEHPWAKGPDGRLRSRIGTVFPAQRTLVTLPGIHATQRMAFIEQLSRDRVQQGLPPLSRYEESELWDNSVDLILEPETIQIRPDPANMALAFQADEVLQEIISKHRIQFLYVLNQQVRDAIKKRGESWRINPLPKSGTEMRRMIAASRIGIGGRELYYYSKAAGTRFLTYHEFELLGALDDVELQRYLSEIAQYAARVNPHGSPEIAFFMTGKRFTKSAWAAYDFGTLPAAAVRPAYEQLRQAFCEALLPEFRHDDLDNIEWRNRMCASLIGQEEDVVPEETLLGLSSEFFMQIEWLPGGRIEEGELIFDCVFDEGRDQPEVQRLCDEKARKFIFNLVREYGDLEYVNVGCVIGSLSHRPKSQGRRDVYIAQIKQRDSEKEIIRILRMQKWGIREHLDRGKSLLDSIIESEEYTEYILDRRLGCRQLGMNLPSRVTARKISERYQGSQTACHGIMIWSPYFERDYIHGIATDKMPHHRFTNERFVFEFARLLGAAAAPNMIVGRCDLAMNVLFDDGDEVIVEDATGMPCDLVVSDQTGTFVDYNRPLQCVAPIYAGPVNRRLEFVPDPEAFARIYLTAFLKRFFNIQREYRKRRRAFDTLFKHRRWDEGGSLAFRWEKVLERLDRTDPRELQELICQKLGVNPFRVPKPHSPTVPVGRAL